MAKILVIEDEESIRENILDLLEAENFEGIGAINGKVGIKLAIDSQEGKGTTFTITLPLICASI